MCVVHHVLLPLPHTLLVSLSPCGHSFCLNCICTWFIRCLNEQLVAKDAPARILMGPFTNARLECIIPYYLWVPLYRCPTCCTLVVRHPVPNLLMSSVSEKVRDAFNARETAESILEHPAVPTDVDVWDGVFFVNGSATSMFL